MLNIKIYKKKIIFNKIIRILLIINDRMITKINNYQFYYKFS